MPKRNKESKRNGIPREVKKLLNRIRILKREKHALKKRKKILKTKYLKQKNN